MKVAVDLSLLRINLIFLSTGFLSVFTVTIPAEGNMESRRATLLELLAWDERVRFVIPKWQRQYVWGTAETSGYEVRQLWEDLKANCLTGGTHFCGVMLFRRVADADSALIEWEIVDGQQRLTTFFLLFIAIRDKCEKDGVDCTELYRVFTTENSSECRLVLKHDLNDDREVLNALLRRAAPALSKKIQDESRVLKAYQLFSNELADISAFDMRDLVLKMVQGVDLLILTADPADDTRRLFETLNGRGRRIDPFDLVANLVNYIGRDNHELNAQAQSVWYFITNNIEKDDLDDFLSVFAKRNAQQTPRGTTLDEIDYEVRRAREQGNVGQWLREFQRAAKYYQDILFPDDAANDSIHVLLSEIKTLRIPKLNPFLLALLEAFGNTPASEPLINNVRSLMVRLLITYDRPAYKIERFAELACQKFYDEGVPKPERLEQVIQLIDDHWIDDATFTQAFTSKVLYGPGAHLSRLRYYLEKLELKSAEASGHPFEVHFGRKTTVEHIMPQTLNDVWRGALRIHDPVRLHAQHQALVDTIGNLTVLLFGDNSSVQNESFATKKEFYLNPVQAFKNRGVRSRKAAIGNCALNRYFENISAWNFQAIVDRGQYLATLALDIWKKEPWNRETT